MSDQEISQFNTIILNAANQGLYWTYIDISLFTDKFSNFLKNNGYKIVFSASQYQVFTSGLISFRKPTLLHLDKDIISAVQANDIAVKFNKNKNEIKMK